MMKILEYHVTQKKTVNKLRNRQIKKMKRNLREKTRFTEIHWKLVTWSTIVTSQKARELQIY